MEFLDYIKSKRTGCKIPADIVERWRTRVEPRGLQKQGEAGARQYLADYGKGIGAPKVILLALQAEASGCMEMAGGFWKKAYQLETGNVAPDGEGSLTPTTLREGQSPAETKNALRSPAIAVPALVEPFPEHLQPGRLIPMQPVDGTHSREYYIKHPGHWCQPKRDGKKLIVFGTETAGYYQSRSLNLRGAPSVEFENAIKAAAKEFGPFILEGELYFLDVNGKEHRTSAQAATVNIEAGKGENAPIMRYMAFACLYNGLDFTGATYAVRVRESIRITTFLHVIDAGLFEITPVATEAFEKAQLASTQKSEGREGEIWFDPQLSYVPGKNSGEKLVRTKYLTELDVLVTKLTPTSAEGRLFGAIKVSSLDGKPLGLIGSGFAWADQQKIAARHAVTPGKVVIPVVCQGFTETGQIWHGRLSEDFE